MVGRGIIEPMKRFVAIRRAGVVLVLALSFVAPFAHAADGNQLVITWHASRSYVPPAYEGKALPNQSSQITASVEAFSNGHRADLSKSNVYWYLNDVLMGGGTGIRTNTFTLFGGAGSSAQTLRVEVPDYPGGYLIATTPLPLVDPVVVVNAPYPGGQVSANPFMVSALPYFFNITSPNQLGFSWSVNGQVATNAENPNDLQVTMGAGTTAGTAFNISLTATNALDSMSASNQTTLTYQQLP